MIRAEAADDETTSTRSDKYLVSHDIITLCHLDSRCRTCVAQT